MALTEPYSLAFLSSILPVADCTFEPLVFEEQSGSGSGQFWTAQMADPLWQVSLSLASCAWPLAREINAKVTALGSMKSMHFRDPIYVPAAGGNPGSGVSVSAISADRTAIALTGLPAGYVVTAGDRLSILRSSASYYFGEFAETVTASGSGVTVQIGINPPLPMLLATGAAATLGGPIIRLRVPPGGFKPYTQMLGGYSSGASLTMVQKR